MSKETGQPVPGSPVIALQVEPPFREYHLIDLNAEKVEHLRRVIADRRGVHVYAGDCNPILLNKIFPTLEYKTYRRALCLLDPYGLHLDWRVIHRAGQLGTVDMFLNFPVMDMNRNVLWRMPHRVPQENVPRLNFFWGDESWKDVAYSRDWNLFGEPEKEPNEVIAEGFRQRLLQVAGFNRVPKPLPMRNNTGATVYYLFFASQVDVAEKIIQDIFNKYRAMG